MNKTLSNFARDLLKLNLAKCTEAQQHLFRQMYSHKDMERPIDDVVDAMPDDKLDWAIQQCERTVENNLRTAIA
jgi:hypothetical protein